MSLIHSDLPSPLPSHSAKNLQKPQKVIWILAGEASGDILGARLMESLLKINPSLVFYGVGGHAMKEKGLHSLFPIQELAVMGLVEILPKIFHLFQRLRQAEHHIATLKPDAVVTIDSPAFSLRLLKRISHLHIPRIHYVAPQVWAWKEKRVKKFPGLWEKLLCLLPFEKDFFSKHHVPVQFVGHPILQSGANQGQAERFLTKYAIPPSSPVLILMPGSRRSEIPKLLPVFKEMLTLLYKKKPSLSVVIPTPSIMEEHVRHAIEDWPIHPIIITDVQDKYDAFAAAQAALTKSGTSTLELAFAGVPMAVTYRVNPITAILARRLIKVKNVAMINLLMETPAVPELLQEHCTPPILAQTVLDLLDNTHEKLKQKMAFQRALKSLHSPQPNKTPSETAAQAIMSLLNKENRS
ncbi:lipid-A-disaccharide synthase [Entomobacter blattae]|uniref:Lipid-A-disaccharide synthase n=1 Tax=Entomobacter blattae TaxID=2762277 RepID=A0A7H1NSR2_9PROT|nr:lipid-A-disaccharide synthase [Entomobacter blattae]QNT78822.1 Lipid-A-disaccharide synthase [Entomobacter blattae]